MTNVSVRLCTLAAALAALALTCISPTIALGQSGVIRVNIPFDFYLGSQKLPAGEYTVVRHADPALIHLYDGNGHTSAALSNAVSNRSKTWDAQLVFNRYGDQYFLSEVRGWGSLFARQLIKSSFEVEVAKSSTAERVATSIRDK